MQQVPPPATKEAARTQIGALLRTERRRLGLSQAALGEKISLKRYSILRLESGALDLRPDQAKLLEEALDVTGLAELVALRESLPEADAKTPDRDLALRQLIAGGPIRSIDAVLADDADLHEVLAGDPSMAGAAVSVTVPTEAWESRLLGGPLLFGHVEQQLKRLSDMTSSGLLSAAGSIRCYESDRVVQSAMVVRGDDWTACAIWPTLVSALGIDGTRTPAIVTSDANVVTQVAEYITHVRGNAEPIQKNEALVILGEQDSASDSQVLFTRYVMHGNEEDEYGPPGTQEGFAVSLVLLHGVVPREGHPLDHRIVLHRRTKERDDSERWSLVSNRVDDLDIRRALVPAESLPEGRSTRSANAAGLEIRDHLDNGVIPPEAFRVSGEREVLAMFGLDVGGGDVPRLHPMTLAPELSFVPKATEDNPGRRPIIPKIFSLELQIRDGVSEFDHIASAMSVVTLGYEDLQDFPDLNDFLLAANRDGWLAHQLAALGVARR